MASLPIAPSTEQATSRTREDDGQRFPYGYCAFVGAGALLVILAAWVGWRWEHIHARILCHEYRHDLHWHGWGQGREALWSLSDYFRKHHAAMTESEVISLLGPPRVETGKDDAGLVDVKGWLESLERRPNGTERVLVYCDTGPPDHFIPDEHGALFFLIQDSKVVDFNELFP